MWVYACVYVCVCVCVCMHVYMYICVCVYACGRVYVCIYLVIYTHCCYTARTISPVVGRGLYLAWGRSYDTGTKAETTRLWQKYLIDCDDIFFVLLTRIIARSVARFYLPNCTLNIPIYQITNGLFPNDSISQNGKIKAKWKW